MIPDIAVIISTYAIARLLCEYVLQDEKVRPLRTLVAVLAMGVIVLFLFSVIGTAGSLSDLNI